MIPVHDTLYCTANAIDLLSFLQLVQLCALLLQPELHPELQPGGRKHVDHPADVPQPAAHWHQRSLAPSRSRGTGVQGMIHR